MAGFAGLAGVSLAFGFSGVSDLSGAAAGTPAAGVARLAAGYAKTLVVDLALVIQGETEDELPERVVAGWRINNMDLATAKRLE